MRKSKKVNASFDAIDSLTPEEAGALLATEDGVYQTMSVGAEVNADGKITNKIGSVDLGDPTWVGGGPYNPLNPGTFPGVSPSVSPSIGSGMWTITAKNPELEERISALEGQVKVLRQQVDDLQSRVRKGGFWVRPRI